MGFGGVAMRVLVFPLVAAGILAGSTSDEPTERQMRGAFEAALKTYVRSALEFVAETGGPQAVEQVRLAGTDRFDIRSFEKRDCFRAAAGSAFVCSFAVDIDLSNGTLRRALGGRFFASANGLVYADAGDERALPVAGRQLTFNFAGQ